MLKVCCPVTGKVVSNNKIPDATFSQNMMGETIGVIPSSSKFVSPINGKVALCEGHAFAIESKDGIQVLVHIGIDTVKISPADKAKIFKFRVKVGSMVKANEPVAEVDFNKIKALGYDITTPVVVLAETLNGKSVSIQAFGPTEAGEDLFEIA